MTAFMICLYFSSPHTSDVNICGTCTTPQLNFVTGKSEEAEKIFVHTQVTEEGGGLLAHWTLLIATGHKDINCKTTREKVSSITHISISPMQKNEL